MAWGSHVSESTSVVEVGDLETPTVTAWWMWPTWAWWAQNAAQKSSKMSGNDRKEEPQSKLIPLQVPVFAVIYGKIRLRSCRRTRTLMGDTGLELYPNSLRNTQFSKQATHNPTHRLHLTASIAPELQRVIEAWPALPARVRHGLLTIIDAVGGDLGEVHR